MRRLFPPGFLLLLFGSATCQRELPSREPESEAPDAAATVEVRGAEPKLTPSVTTGSDAGEDAAADAAKKIAYGPVPPATPGQVLCGDARCDLATQVCCENEAQGVAQCVPKPKGDEDPCERVEGALYQRRCDEKADCPGAQACCTTWACSGGCPPVITCGDVPCLHGQVEQCLPGGTCSPGFRCVASRDSRLGSCVQERSGVACGKERCSGERPVCCWNTKTQRGSCAADCGEAPNEDLWALGCTSPDDCAGYPCANFVPAPVAFSRCSGAYDVPDRSTVVFCRRLEDCPVMNLMGKPKACLRDRSFPGNTKTCRYPTQ